MTSTQTIRLITSDGCQIEGDLAEPEGPSGGRARGGVVICHPHPRYGGNRHHPVVDAVFRALPAVGFRALRFDFRAEFGGGTAEIADVVAALDELSRLGGGEALFLVGYSFGAVVSLRTTDPRVAGVVAIAPPLGAMPVDTAPAVPVLTLTPRHDQFCPPDVAAPILASWPSAELVPLESADHFLHGHADAVATRTVDWLTERVG